MNALTLVLLVLLAFLFADSGFVFFAFLAIVAAVIILVSEASSGRPAVTMGSSAQGPVYVQYPQELAEKKIQIDPGWMKKDGDELVGERFGSFVNFFGKLVGRIFK